MSTPKVTTTYLYNYYLNRGAPQSPRGYCAYVYENNVGVGQINIDNALKAAPNDKPLKTLRASAVQAIDRCCDKHTKSHRINSLGIPSYPTAVGVFCDPDLNGCGNMYETADKSGRTLKPIKGWDK